MDTLEIEHNGETYRATPHDTSSLSEQGLWSLEDCDWMALTVHRRPGEYPITSGRLKSARDFSGPKKGLQTFEAVRHKFISAALEHDSNED